MPDNNEMISQTQRWVSSVVVGTNFCPFASKEVKNKTIRYAVAEAGSLQDNLDALLASFLNLDAHKEIETIILLYPYGYSNFYDYLNLIDEAEEILIDNDYEGIYQIASFHPEYLFAGSEEKDPANFTNRSIYPMIHILRESSMELALQKHPDPEGIPERNIQYARNKGYAYMKLLREQCL
jgi:hypothetical protein